MFIFFHSENSKPQQAAALLNNDNPNKQIHIPPKQHDALIIANGTNMANSSGIPPASRNRQVVIDMPGNGCIVILFYCYAF